MNKKGIFIFLLCIIIIIIALVSIDILVHYSYKEREAGMLILYDYIYKNKKDIEVSTYLFVPAEQNIEANIGIIIKYLENTVFDGNRLEFDYDSNNRKLTLIFLDEDSKTIFGSKWNNYFQGSSGAYYTYKMLVNNLFQLKRKEIWINELAFQYNNSQFPEMDHISISTTLKRDNSK